MPCSRRGRLYYIQCSLDDHHRPPMSTRIQYQLANGRRNCVKEANEVTLVFVHNLLGCEMIDSLYNTPYNIYNVSHCRDSTCSLQLSVAKPTCWVPTLNAVKYYYLDQWKQSSASQVKTFWRKTSPTTQKSVRIQSKLNMLNNAKTYLPDQPQQFLLHSLQTLEKQDQGWKYLQKLKRRCYQTSD